MNAETSNRTEAPRVYLFFRGEGFFYPIELADDDDARRNAEHNPGTTRVEDVRGRVVWRQP